MTKRHQLDIRRHNLGEIREILEAMKNFAFMETRKLGRALPPQQAVVANLEAVAADFRASYALETPALPGATPVHIVIGSERGFCGDFNHVLARQALELMDASPLAAGRLIVIGRKLHHLFEGDSRVVAAISGASVLEDLETVLIQLAAELSRIRQQNPLLTLQGIYFGNEKELSVRPLLPPFQSLAHEPAGKLAFPPELNLEPQAFYLPLSEQYLLAALYEMLSMSLMNENRRRMVHLEEAVDHLGDEEDDLLRRANVLRQEEITEELEVILLSAEGSDPGTSSKSSG